MAFTVETLTVGNITPSSIVANGNVSFPLEGWSSRKTKTVSRESGEVTNYQMRLLIGESAGSVGADIHCEGKCNSDFSDLRFTNENGDLLSYWIESISGATPNQLATVWIRIDTIHTTDTPVFMYYENPSASAYSSITDTFRTEDGHFGDDFERGNDGDAVGGDWTNVGGTTNASISTTHSVSGTRCVKMSGNYTQYISAPVTPSDNIAIRVKFWKEDGLADFRIYHGKNGTHSTAYVWIASENSLYYTNSSGQIDTEKDVKSDSWDEIELCNFDWSSEVYDIYYTDYALAKSGAGAHQISLNAGNQLWLYNWGTAGKSIYFDNVIVRNYRTVEPVWGGESFPRVTRRGFCYKIKES